MSRAKRTEIMAKIRADTAFMERTAVHLDHLDHPVALPADCERVVELRASRQAEMCQAIKRTRENLDQLAEMLSA